MDVIASGGRADGPQAPWTDLGAAHAGAGPAAQQGDLDLEQEDIEDLRQALDRMDGTRWAHEFDGVSLRLRRGWQGLRLAIWLPLSLWIGGALAGAVGALLSPLAESTIGLIVLVLTCLVVQVEVVRRAVRYASPTEVTISKRTRRASRGGGGGGRAWTVGLDEVDQVRYVQPRPGVGRLMLGKQRLLLEVHSPERLPALQELGEALADWLDKDFHGTRAPTDAHPYRA